MFFLKTFPVFLALYQLWDMGSRNRTSGLQTQFEKNKTIIEGNLLYKLLEYRACNMQKKKASKSILQKAVKWF